MRLTVGEISKVLGISNENIRYYVREGLVKPEKNEENNYWAYSSEDVLIISDILFYRDLDISINNIRRIIDGLQVEKIGDVINETRKEALEKIDELRRIVSRLDEWQDAYNTEMQLLGDYSIGNMPPELRKLDYYDEQDHIANYLENNLHIERSDWMYVSLSFFCDINQKPLQLKRYMTVEKNKDTVYSNHTGDIIEETKEKCIITQVKFSERIEDMINPIMDYAKEHNYELVGEVYGRERTNFYENGKRNGVYTIFAPIK